MLGVRIHMQTKKLISIIGMTFSSFISTIFFLWAYVYEVMVWKKSLLESFQSSGLNWLGFFVFTSLVVLFWYLEDVKDFRFPHLALRKKREQVVEKKERGWDQP